MKVKSKKILRLIFILILIIIFINIFFLKKLSKTQKIDDILFLKLFSNGILNKHSNEENNEYNNQLQQDANKYEFRVSYKNMDFKTIDLLKTINRETLVYDKIAPGTSGSFDILLNSNQSLKYKIEFYSINEKPQNLKFRAFKDNKIIGEASTLEGLSEKLNGNINKNQEIKITINWYWDYENNKEDSDVQDTKDAENIRTYEFRISTRGE